MDRIIESRKVKQDILAYLYSDLHYVPGDDLAFLAEGIEKVKLDKPDYAFFLGDLLHDSSYYLRDYGVLLEWLFQLAQETKVILVLGNHDQLTKDRKGKWKTSYNWELVSAVKDMGVTVLQNQMYEDDLICVYGMRFPGSYYEEAEPTNTFLDAIRDVKFSGANKFNILLEHSPRNTFNSRLMREVENIDLILAGHYHNGCVPWYLDKLLGGNKGLIDPYGKLFPFMARGEAKIVDSTKGIIVAPITTLAEHKILNMMYPPIDQRLLIKKIK